MDAGTRSIEPYAIDVPGSIAAVCQSRDDVQAVLAIDEAGQSVLHTFSDGGTTARQAAQAIDAKVQLYLAEQYG